MSTHQQFNSCFAGTRACALLVCMTLCMHSPVCMCTCAHTNISLLGPGVHQAAPSAARLASDCMHIPNGPTSHNLMLEAAVLLVNCVRPPAFWQALHEWHNFCMRAHVDGMHVRADNSGPGVEEIPRPVGDHQDWLPSVPRSAQLQEQGQGSIWRVNAALQLQVRSKWVPTLEGGQAGMPFCTSMPPLLPNATASSSIFQVLSGNWASCGASPFSSLPSCLHRQGAKAKLKCDSHTCWIPC